MTSPQSTGKAERPPAREGVHTADNSTATFYTPSGDRASTVIALSAEREWWTRRLLDAERAAYRRGYTDGRADERHDADREWAGRPPVPVSTGPALAELEAQRWALRGEARTRATFGEPHRSDYPSRESS